MFLLAPAAKASSGKGKAASCLTGPAGVGANGGIMRVLTFRERMRDEAAKTATAETADPWRLTLERVRGKVDFFDRLERISSQALLDLLGVPQRKRTTGVFRRLSRVMTELGWTALRVSDL